MKKSRQEMIDERHKIYLKLMEGMVEGREAKDKLIDRYHWLQNKIKKINNSP